MPLPFLLIPIAAKVAAICKTAAVASKGAAVATKVVGSKHAAAKLATSAVHTFGVGQTVAYAAVGTLSLGAAALLYESARRLRTAIRDGDGSAALSEASLLARRCAGVGGLEDARRVLHDLSIAGPRCPDTVRRVDAMLDDLLRHLHRRLDD